MPKNPNWSRDELILALDFYVHHSPHIPDKKSPEIAELSQTLNRFWHKLGEESSETFRNPNGVYMKLMNFRRFDPDYEGKGLERGGKDEKAVWNLYADHPEELSKAATAIISALDEDWVPTDPWDDSDEAESEEGRILTRTHRIRERDPALVRRKKNQFLKKHGKLFCEACDFNFEQVYGEHGDGYIECHHTKPVSELTPGTKTKLSDLVLVCSNCHRMIHRRRPWLSVEELKQVLSH